MKKYIPLTIGLLAVVVLLAFMVGQGRAQERGAVEAEALPAGVEDSVGHSFPIQGRLTDASGMPLNGTYDITFRLYTESTGDTMVCDDTNIVSVDNGLFNSYIWGDCAGKINGQQLYLGIEVESDGEMSPRQPIYAVPYAFSLRPGATISATLGGAPLVHIENLGEEGRGLRVYATSTTGANYGIVGATRSPDGYGGYFYNNYGGTALYGLANNDTLGGIGVRGESEIGSGIYGKSTEGYGIYGLSTNMNALYGDTQRADHNYGVYTADNLYSSNFHSAGAMMQVVQNGGSQPLEAGDVVIFSGVTPPADANEPPVILVSKAATANSAAVAGVVYARSSQAGGTFAGAAQPGEYLLIVVQGPARVKASAAAGAIRAGDLLSSSAQAGVGGGGARITIEGVQTALPGTVFAKALEALESGEGWIYVFVTLQ